LVKRALAEGSEAPFTKWVSASDKYRAADERQLIVTFTGLSPFSRHICAMKATTRVIEAHHMYLD
jgi:hypothetical protein